MDRPIVYSVPYVYGTSNVLLEADSEAQLAWEQRMEDEYGESEMRFIRMIHVDAVLRSLIEFKLNQCLAWQAYRPLALMGYMDQELFISRAATFRGEAFVGVKLTDRGQAYVRQFYEMAEDGGSEKDFLSALAGYLCRHSGDGICYGSSLFETMLETRDRELLREAVNLRTEGGPLEIDMASLVDVTIGERAENAKFWCLFVEDRKHFHLVDTREKPDLAEGSSYETFEEGTDN